MHRLLKKQIEKAQLEGRLDKDQLYNLVSQAYTQMEKDRDRGERASILMADEMEELNDRLKEAVENLQVEKLHLEVALDNMSLGLCMFDEYDRLVLWNQRFIELFDVEDGALEPGITRMECLALCNPYRSMGAEFFRTSAENLQHLVTQALPGKLVFRLPDGRTLKLTHRPMGGQGSVQTIEDVTDRVNAEKKMRHMAHHDALTGLANRILFNKRIEEAVMRKREYGEDSAVFCLDLDRFKEVNDTLGHATGDRLLVEVSQRIKQLIKSSDTLSRLGGDEFAIIQAKLKNHSEVKELAEEIIQEIEKPFYIDGNEILISTSIGIALNDDPECLKSYELLRDADLALYSAKAQRNGAYHFYREEMSLNLIQRKRHESEMRHGLSENHFEVYYQPQVKADNNSVVGGEALIRWNHPVRGYIAPAEFIDLSEESGLITPLTELVLKSACSSFADWPDFKVAVNLSPLQFRKPGVYEMVLDVLHETGFDPGKLELEITEGALLYDEETTLATLKQLKSLGISIAMDDFGTGYSSLSYLRNFPFDKLKIDQSFVKELGYSDESNSIIQAVINLGKSLGMRINAEGVETHLQADILRLEGCDELQGYYFGKPMDYRSFERLFQHEKKSRELSLKLQNWSL